MEEKRFQKGLEIRRQVLGAEHVEASMSKADEFTRPLQEIITEYCWGEIWSRGVLDRKTRSLITLAMLTALNRPHELRLHIKGAINNGCTREEMREVLLQAIPYCGIPAAVDSFRVAQEVLREIEEKSQP